jgi:uncharacterized protein (DUF488 family)
MTELYTIGHSSYSFNRFVTYLKSCKVDALIDVRSNPYSRFHPQYRYKALKAGLPDANIDYIFLGKQLGARSKDPAHYIDGRVSYRLLAQSPVFKEGLKELLRMTREARVCIMCAEKDPLDCHRMLLVCRHLRDQPLEIRHILADGSVESHPDTEKRLIKRAGLHQPDLFPQPGDTVERAYDLQAEKIVFGS